MPHEEGGPDSEDNAAPLCPSCHETYGGNPQKRKFIREARDLWYDICDRRYLSDPDRLEDIASRLENAATKQDLDDAITKITDLLRTSAARTGVSQQTVKQDVAHLGGMLTPNVAFSKSCPKCRTFVGMLVGDTGRCPTCGTPW